MSSPISIFYFLHQRKSVYYSSVVSPGLCHPCSGTQMGLPPFGGLPVTETEETWEIRYWLLKLPLKSDIHPFHSYFIGQSMSHGHMKHKGAGKYHPTVCLEEDMELFSALHWPLPQVLSVHPQGWQICLKPSKLSDLVCISPNAHFPGVLVGLHQMPWNLPSPFTSLCSSALPTLPTLRNDLPKLILEVYHETTLYTNSINRECLLKRRIISSSFLYQHLDS